MVYVYLSNGFEEIEALTVVDLLRRASLEVQTVAVNPTGTEDKLLVKGAHNICVKAEITIEETNYEACDMIVLPGGMPGTTNLLNCEVLVENIKDLVAQNRYVAAICAAPMVLGQNGLLHGREAVCYPGMENYLEGARLSEENVVVDEKIITSKGPGTAMEFALTLIKLLVGEEKFDEIKADILY